MPDLVVVGGGTNGLAAAALCAQQGKRVVLCERREVLGGLAAPEPFHDGREAPGVLQDTSQLSRRVVESLDLARHGLRVGARRPDVLVLEPGGPGLVLAGDDGRAVAELRRVSPADAERWPEFRAFVGRLAPALDALFAEAPPDTTDTSLPAILALGKRAVALRRLGKRDLLELLRVAPMAAADFVREWFESDLVHGGLILPAVSGTWLGPWSAGSALQVLLHQHRSRVDVAGGPPALARALTAAAREAGVELRTGAEVEEILVESGCAVGVRLAGGEDLRAPAVLATCDPKSALLCLVPRHALGHRLRTRLEHFRTRGTTAVLRLALSAPLEYPGRPGERFAHACAAGSIEQLERAFDAVKYRAVSAEPLLEILAHGAEGAGPVASLLVHYAPYDVEGGWTSERADRLAESALDRLEALVPGARERVVGRELLTPLDLERRLGTTGGHVHHGEHALDQHLLRPTPETSRYATPIAGLFLGGSGSHPGGGLTCEPGRLAVALAAER